MRVAVSQINPTIADLYGIFNKISSEIKKAEDENAELIVFSEMITTGYPPKDLLERESFIENQWIMVKNLAKKAKIPVVIGCVEPLMEGNSPHLANALVVLQDGEIKHSYHKRLLPTYDIFDEKRYFRSGDSPLIVEINNKKIGLTICEDIWSENFSGIINHIDPVADMVNNCDIMINISASPYSYNKPNVRNKLISSIAKRIHAPVIYCNQVGGQDEILFDGASCVVNKEGAIIALAKRWEEDFIVVDVESKKEIVNSIINIEDLNKGIVTGIKDYCTKTNQKRVVLGLSGGIDSALVATLAVDALGSENVVGILMPGPYSSQGSIDDAEELAKNLNIKTYTCPIKDANNSILETLSGVFDGTEPNVAEENIQARLRGLIVMAYANKFSAMALTTGNKSELAVGYCTIYGDMNGGLAPIGDLYKTTTWELSKFINKNNIRIPVNSITKPPSAELAPDQKDEDSLPPYEELDRILLAFLEKNRSIEDLIEGGENPAVVKRIIRLLEVNEYKRRQAAPVLRVSDKAFGVGRRIPMARMISELF